MRRSNKRRDRAGHFDTRVIVYRQNPSTAANTDGQIPETALELCRRWAEVVPLRQRLIDRGASQEGNITHVVRMPYCEETKTITPEQWLVMADTSQRLNIVGMLDVDNLHRVVELECTERVT